MRNSWFMLNWVLSILSGYFGGRLLVLFLEKVAHLPFYAWQEELIGVIGSILTFYLFCKRIDGKNK